MADTKPFNFTTIGVIDDDTFLHSQPNGTQDVKFFMTTVWNYIRGKINGGNQVISNGDSVAINPDEMLVAITFVSATSQTIDVGTTPGGDELLADIELVASEVHTEVLHYQFTAAASLYFTFPGGDVTVRIKKL